MKGRPEPLWRPISDDIPEENQPSSSSSSSTTPKAIAFSSGQSSDGAPPSPRTLQAIQAAMMDSSSDDEHSTSKRTVQSDSRTASSREENGDVSPRTLQAIQRALMEDSSVTEEVQPQQQKYVIVSSSDDDEDDDDQAGVERSVLCKAPEGGGVSPQTLLSIQRALGEKGSFTGIKRVEHTGFLSSSEGEEVEEVVGVRSEEHDASVLKSKQSAPKTASSCAELLSDEGTLPQGQEASCNSENHFLQKGSVSINLTEEEKEERNEQITVKSEEEEEKDSNSEGIWHICSCTILFIQCENLNQH